MKHLLFTALFVAIGVFASQAQSVFTVNDLINLKRVTDPQLSPDGRLVAFTIGVVDKAANKTVNQIYTIGIDGTRQKQITSNPSSSSSPRWSPDGKWIVYASNEGFDSKKLRNFDIWIMTASGSKRTQLTTNGSDDISPCWDYEGKMVYFLSNRGGVWNIWRFQPNLTSE